LTITISATLLVACALLILSALGQCQDYLPAKNTANDKSLNIHLYATRWKPRTTSKHG